MLYSSIFLIPVYIILCVVLFDSIHNWNQVGAVPEIECVRAIRVLRYAVRGRLLPSVKLERSLS